MAMRTGSKKSTLNGVARVRLIVCHGEVLFVSMGAKYRSSPVVLRSLSALLTKRTGLSMGMRGRIRKRVVNAHTYVSGKVKRTKKKQTPV